MRSPLAVVLLIALVMVIPAGFVSGVSGDEAPVEDTDISTSLIERIIGMNSDLNERFTKDNASIIVDVLLNVEDDTFDTVDIKETTEISDAYAVGGHSVYRFTNDAELVFLEGSVLILGKNFTITGQGNVIRMEKGSSVRLSDKCVIPIDEDTEFEVSGRLVSEYSLTRTSALSVEIEQCMDIEGRIGIGERLSIQGVKGHAIQNTIKGGLTKLSPDPLEDLTFTVDGSINLSKVKAKFPTVKGSSATISTLYLNTDYSVSYDPNKTDRFTVDAFISSEGDLDVGYNKDVDWSTVYNVQYKTETAIGFTSDRLPMDGNGIAFRLKTSSEGEMVLDYNIDVKGMELKLDVDNIDREDALSLNVDCSVDEIKGFVWIDDHNSDFDVKNASLKGYYAIPVADIPIIRNINDIIYYGTMAADINIESFVDTDSTYDFDKTASTEYNVSLLTAHIPDLGYRHYKDPWFRLHGAEFSIRGGKLIQHNVQGISEINVMVRRTSAVLNMVDGYAELNAHRILYTMDVKGDMDPHMLIENARMQYPLTADRAMSLVMLEGDYDFEFLTFQRLSFGEKANVILRNVGVYELYIPETHGSIEGQIMIHMPLETGLVSTVRIGKEIDLALLGTKIVGEGEYSVKYPAWIDLIMEDELYCAFTVNIGLTLLPPEEGYRDYDVNTGELSSLTGKYKVFAKQDDVTYTYPDGEVVQTKAYEVIDDLKVLEDEGDKRFIGWFDGVTEVMKGEPYIAEPFDVELKAMWSSSPEPIIEDKTIVVKGDTEEILITDDTIETILEDMERHKIDKLKVVTSNATVILDKSDINDMADGLKIRVQLIWDIMDEDMRSIVENGCLVRIDSNVYDLYNEAHVIVTYPIPYYDYSNEDLKAYLIYEGGLLEVPLDSELYRNRVSADITVYHLTDYILKDHKDKEFEGNAIEAWVFVAIGVGLLLAMVTLVALHMRR